MIGLGDEWAFERRPHISVDTETRNLHAHKAGGVFLIQWATDSWEKCCAADDDKGVAEFRHDVSKVKRITMANAGFDTHSLRSSGIIDFLTTGHEVLDVQTLGRVVLPERGFKGYKLKQLGVDLMGADADEEERELKKLCEEIGLRTLKKEGAHYLLWQHFPRQLEAYGMQDVRLTHDLFDLIVSRASPQDLAVFMFESAVQRELLLAEQHGVLVDKVALAKLRVEVEARIAAAAEGLQKEYERGVRSYFDQVAGFRELREVFEGPPNAKRQRAGGLVGSASGRTERGQKLVGAWAAEDGAFEEHVAGLCLGDDGAQANQTALRCALLGAGVPLYRTTDKSGQLATNKDALAEFEDEFPIIGLLFEWRAATKMLATYVEALERADPRVHANFLSCEARTSRMSCIAEGGLVDAPRNLLLHPRGIPIEDIRVGQFVYSHGDDGVPRPQRVLAKTFMGDKKVLRLVWRACGSKSYLGELVATPDHRVRMEDGSYRRMDELRPNDKLAYLGRSVNANGYSTIRWGADRKVHEHVHLRPGYEVVHHRNRVPQDCSLDNLEGMTRGEHSRLHALEGEFFGGRNTHPRCPYTSEEFRGMVAGGISRAMRSYGHEHARWKAWSVEMQIEIPDARGARNNHRVVMVMSDGETRPTWDLTIENTPCFVVNEIGVHNCRSPNMQNLPRGSGARDCIIPAPGNALLVLDFDSIEVRILAHYLALAAKHTELRDAVEGGLDAHTRTAAQVFGHRPPDQGGPPPGVPALEWYAKGAGGDAERTVTKNTVFASMYGVGVAKLSRMIGKDAEEGRRIKNAVLGAIDGYWDLIDALKLKMRQARHLKTVLGRRLDVPIGKTHVYLNSVVQGSAAEAMKLALLAAAPRLREVGYQVILVVHDELVAEGPVDRADEALDICRAAMETVSDYFACKMKATGGYSTDSYAAAK